MPSWYSMKHQDAYCILGGGPSGLVAARNFMAAGIPVEILEQQDDFGGNWYFGSPHSSVFPTTHLISSKRMSQFEGFPMPKAYSPYPSHEQVLAYLRDFARHYRLYEVAQFGKAVQQLEPAEGSWKVTLTSGEVRLYRGVVIANGHHSTPLWPKWEGTFAGTTLHAKQYKSPSQWEGKRVLVVGGGNSGCDIAVDASRMAKSTAISWRRGYHILPKFIWGGPLDAGGELYDRWKVPMGMRRWLTSWMLSVVQGDLTRYGLPAPEHPLFAAHPIVNSQLLYQLGHGKIAVYPDIQRVDGHTVYFSNGKSADFDAIVCATGYQVSFPFLDLALLRSKEQSQDDWSLYLNAFSPRWKNLFVAGLIQPNGAIWPLADLQSQLMAAYAKAQSEDPAAAALFAERLRTPWEGASGGLEYDKSPRHRFEVEFFDYRRQLRTLLGQFPAHCRPQISVT
ncbi:MAG: NAD(P)-binding domain-containing protein [Pirellulales bacterium]